MRDIKSLCSGFHPSRPSSCGTSGSPLIDVSTDRIADRPAIDATIAQLTCPIATAVPIAAIADCASVLSALIPAALSHLIVDSFMVLSSLKQFAYRDTYRGGYECPNQFFPVCPRF